MNRSMQFLTHLLIFVSFCVATCYIRITRRIYLIVFKAVSFKLTVTVTEMANN